MNTIFVTKKPLFISSNRYLNILKKRLNIKKLGFSGTLDPFATGTLIVATNDFCKLFNYIDKSPKKYIATIFIGLISKSLDLENIVEVKNIKSNINKDDILKVFNSLIGEISYQPPIFSAKKIDGKRAYKLAREDKNIQLKKITSTIFDIKLINFNYPFITFEIDVSEGSYIRSIAQIILEKLNLVGSLSYLNRVKEGSFTYQNQERLNIFNFLKIDQNFYSGQKQDFIYGKKLNLDNFKYKDSGEYYIKFDDFFSIIEIKNKKVTYKVNKITID